VTTVALALAAGALFGLIAVAARWALGRGADAEAGAAVTAMVGAAIGVALAAGAGQLESTSWSQLWPYVAIGIAAPGFAQILFVHAVRTAGPSRTAIVIGTAPVLSAIIAIWALGERPHFALGLGTALIVLGGIALAWESARPAEFRSIGLALALACAILFATRDNLLRAIADEEAPPVLLASAVSLGAAAVAVLLYVGARQGTSAPRRISSAFLPFLPAGIALGLAYASLLAAFDRGEVTLVAPLNATQSLWAIALAALVIGRRADAIGRRLVFAGVLVVAGSALVAAFR